MSVAARKRKAIDLEENGHADVVEKQQSLSKAKKTSVIAKSHSSLSRAGAKGMCCTVNFKSYALKYTNC